jgi:hypothetical protein
LPIKSFSEFALRILRRLQILGGIDLLLQVPQRRVERGELALALHRHRADLVAGGAQQPDLQVQPLVGQLLRRPRRLVGRLRRRRLGVGQRLLRLGSVLGGIDLQLQRPQALVHRGELVRPLGRKRAGGIALASISWISSSRACARGLGRRLRRLLGRLAASASASRQRSCAALASSAA